MRKHVGQLVIGSGEIITKHSSWTKTWDPSTVGAGAFTSTTIAVPCAFGDTVVVSFSLALPAGVILSGAVTGVDTVTVTLYNATSGAVDLASGTLRADVWKH